MQIEKIGTLTEGKNFGFKSKRVHRNIITQLTKNNSYSLTEPNQRLIKNAITEFSKNYDKKSIDFLITTAAKTKYSTNIVLKDAPKNDWKTILLTAAAGAAAAVASVTDRLNLFNKIEEAGEVKELNKTELEILDLREQLLSSIDLKQVQDETLGPIKDFERNLDYFIISSETTLEHKKYVLKQLKHFMSDKYKINPQLEGKKSIVVAEMINDMAINVPGNKIPNMKAVNQQSHGMCAAISITRKKLAYENKPAYVDIILSELDNKDVLMVYDRNELGSKKKIPIEKVPVDFTTALAQGYRIIDASALHWMNILGINGSYNMSYREYVPFDTENFDVRKDTSFVTKMENPEYEKTQEYYNALLKADSVIRNYKAALIRKTVNKENKRLNSHHTIELLGETGQLLRKELHSLKPELTQEELRTLMNELLDLREKKSKDIKKEDKFSYIPNEEAIVKKERISNFLKEKLNLESIDSKNIDNIFSIVVDFHGLNESLKTSSGNKYTYNKAHSLYKVAAAFRYQMIKGLEEDKTLENVILKENMPNKETILFSAIDEILYRLENSDNDEVEAIIEQTNFLFDNTLSSKEDAIDSFNEIKNILSEMLTTTMDEIYNDMGLGDRKNALLSHIQTMKSAAEANDKVLIKHFAKLWNVKENKQSILKELEKIETQLSEGDEVEYLKSSLKMGHASQLSLAKNLLAVAKTGFAPESEEAAAVEAIEMKLNSIDKFLNQCEENIKLYDSNGRIVISANTKDIIIKNLENKHTIISAEKLEELQTHFEKYENEYSSHDFDENFKKVSKELRTFSKSEKETLDEIKKNINPMYSYVSRQLNAVKTSFKKPLEELNKLLGLNLGSYWVHGTYSGLPASTDVRILEYITGEPHFATHDIKMAIDRIKNTPYSAISGSHVDHDEVSGHAQYIADIKPFEYKIKDKDGERTIIKEAIMHDNTWGTIENRNTWVDSHGIKRLDYGSKSGGTLGYIFDEENYRNGNFTDRVTGEMLLNASEEYLDNKVYKHLKNIKDDYDNEFSAPQYYTMVLNGKSPEAKKISAEIHDAIFVSPTEMMKTAKKLAKNVTEQEVTDMIKRVGIYDTTWETKYEQLTSRIFPVFGEGITTKEQYDKLANDDPLKVTLEKIALKRNYPLALMEAELSKVTNIEEFPKFKTSQTSRALNAVKYAFGKDLAVIDYVVDSFTEENDNDIENILEKYSVKLSDEEYMELFSSLKVDPDKFNGSVDSIASTLYEELEKRFNEKFENKTLVNELLDYMGNFIGEALYFNLDDIKNPKLQPLIKFIDREFKPESNTELVKIYRKIQDMPEDKFKKIIIPRLTKADLGIKNLTGYDILKKLLMHDDKTEKDVRNTIFANTISVDTEHSKSGKSFKTERFVKREMFIPRYNLEEAYITMLNDASLLTYPKLFNKYKEDGIRKHNAFPAYPNVDYLGDAVQTGFKSLVSSINDNIIKIKAFEEQKENYEISHKFAEYIETLPVEEIPNDLTIEEIKFLARRLIVINESDSTGELIVANAKEIVSLPDDATWADYLQYISTIQAILQGMENTTSGYDLEKMIITEKTELDITKKLFMQSHIQSRYQSKLTRLVNEYERSIIKNQKNAAELQENLWKEYLKAHILQNPEELVQNYVKSLTKDTKFDKVRPVFNTYLKRALDYSKLADIQSILMKAVDKSVELNVAKIFDEYKITMKNPKTKMPEEYSMGSEEMIAYMVNNLVLDNNNDTALLFIEKLGLGESYVNFMLEHFNLESLKKSFGIVKQSSKDAPQFMNKLDEIVLEANDELTNQKKDHILVLGDLRTKIQDLGTTYQIDSELLEIFTNMIDNIAQAIAENPNAEKDLLFTALMGNAKQEFAQNMQAIIDSNLEIIKQNETVINLINGILLRNNSEACKKREKFNQEYMDLMNSEEFNENLPVQE